MNHRTRLLLALFALLIAAPSLAQITLYEHEGYRGRAFSANGPAANLKGANFNDAASSIVVERGTWEVCEDAHYRGSCHVLRQGAYPSLRQFGLDNRISSVRAINARRGQPGVIAPPMSQPDYPYRRRHNERLYQAEVTSVRAVYGDGRQQCWADGQYSQSRDRDRNVGGAILGGILGGIIGHQIGDGSGQTAATVGGAAVGAAIGSNVGRDRDRDYRDGRGYDRNLQRCRDNRRGQPTYWDVSYVYRNTEHWVRMSYPPGRTISVNSRGEPRE